MPSCGCGCVDKSKEAKKKKIYYKGKEVKAQKK